MSKTTTATLPHADWCAGERVETTDRPDFGITTTHCVDCGAHEAKDRQGKSLTIPAVTGGLAERRRGAAYEVSMEPTGGAA